MLSTEERKTLLDIAHSSIRFAVCGTSREEKSENIYPSESALSQHAGAFVTVNRGQILRGCLGLIVSDAPLVETVSELAGRSATEDPRFPPVTESELNEIRVEISVLSPLTEISSVEEIHVGTHGLFIDAGMYRGLLLPQVAVHHHWDRDRFLEETCTKAGLPPDHWKHAETRIYIFSAEIIDEEFL